MENTPPENPKPPEMQFDSVEYADAGDAVLTCTSCRQAIAEEYYDINGQTSCPTCYTRFQKHFLSGSRFVRVVMAIFLGVLAGLLGAAIYFIVAKITGYEIGWIALIVGLLVGGAVKIGSRARGGWFYQLLAMFLTYAAISGSYAIFAMAEMVEHPEQFSEITGVTSAPSVEGFPIDQNLIAKSQPVDSLTAQSAPSAATQPAASITDQSFDDLSAGEKLFSILLFVVLMCIFVLAMPIFAMFESPMSLLIIAFGLYAAWKINRRVPQNVSGPYRISAQPPPPVNPPYPDAGIPTNG